MADPDTRIRKIDELLRTLTGSGRLNLTHKIVSNDQTEQQVGEPVSQPVSATEQAKSGASSPEICVELSGPDVPLVLARNGELLLAIEHIAAKILRFEHEEHDRISFDAENFKVLRHQELRMAAEAAIERVRHTGQPFSFAPMSSRERRILHLELANSGLATASSGEGSRRFVVLYPENAKPQSTADRTAAIRSTFRRR